MPASDLALGELARPAAAPGQRHRQVRPVALAQPSTTTALGGALEYSTDLFDAPTIERMAGHFAALLDGIVADPQAVDRAAAAAGRSASASSCWSVERHRARLPAAPDPAPALRGSRSRAAPQATAVVFEDRAARPTPSSNARANRLAHHLRTLGVGPDVLVGLCMQRSPDMVVALLAILKAGGAYVPLDPRLPARAPGLHARGYRRPGGAHRARRCARSLPAHRGPRAVHRHRLAPPRPAPRHQPRAAAPTQDHLAYVIYTSGSTGTPKGVMVPHRAVVQLVINTDYVRIGPDGQRRAASNSSFDAATFEIWGALLNGARLVIVPGMCCCLALALARQIEDASHQHDVPDHGAVQRLRCARAGPLPRP